MANHKFKIPSAVKSELAALHARIADLSKINCSSLLFGQSGTHLSPQDDTLLIPEVFSLTNIQHAQEHYHQFGFVVFNVFEGEEYEFRNKCAEHHFSEIYLYLKKFGLEAVGTDNIKRVNSIWRKKEFPTKLNLGIIGGTMFQTSANKYQEQMDMDIDEPSEIQPNNSVESAKHLDDYISQSMITWTLRSFCSEAYKHLFQLEGPLLASVEDSTCIFSKTCHLKTFQTDTLHFLPKVFSKDAYQEAKGFLSINEGDSFVTVPYFHTLFQTLYQNMKENKYVNKRTATRAVPPEQYGLDNDRFAKRILLKKGHYLVYNNKMLVQFKEQRSSVEPHVGLNVMFFEPEKRQFTSADHTQRIMAAYTSYVVNDERVFGHTFFTKRRGTQFLLKGKFEPHLNPLLCPSFLQENPYYVNVKMLIHHLNM